jgi:DNA repair protein RecO (recombination protein O)
MLVATRAIVIHAFDYLETSRVLRLLTRDAGVQSVLAKGVRRTRGKFGSGIDLFAEGDAQLYLKPTRDLHTLTTFDVTHSRAAIATDLDRFMAASAFAEVLQRIATGESNPSLYDAAVTTFDAIVEAPVDTVAERTLAGLWQTAAAAGFAPSLDTCASCHTPIDPDVAATFSHAAGGALCPRCAHLSIGNRTLPAAARQALQKWLSGSRTVLTPQDAKAHRRLFREFLAQHLSDPRAMRAYPAWERHDPV